MPWKHKQATNQPTKIIPSKRLNSLMWFIDRTLTGTTKPGQSEPGSQGNEAVIHIPQIPGLEPQYQMKFSVISRTYAGRRSLLPLQRCSRHYLQPQSTRWYTYTYIYIYIKKEREREREREMPIYIYVYKSKVGDLSRGWPERSRFDNYYTKVLGRALLLSLDCFSLPWFPTL